MKYVEGKAFQEQNSKLLAKKKDVKNGKNISKICSEILLKSLTNLSKKINYNQVDIKLEQFTEEELDAVLKKKERKKKRKASCLDEIPAEVWKTRKYDIIHLQSCNTVYKQN